MPRWCDSRPKASRRSACATSPATPASTTARCTGTFRTNYRCWRWSPSVAGNSSAQRLKKATAGKAPGEPALLAASVGFFQFAREFPNLFHLMGGARINVEGEFPTLEAAIVDALQVFAVGFAGTGMAPGIVIERTVIFVAALQGIVTQILHKRLKVAPPKAKAFIADSCRMLIKGVS